MIAPQVHARLPEFEQAWRDTGSLRIDGFLREAVAEELLASLRVLPHLIKEARGAELSFLFYELVMQPEESCDHVTCRFARWLFSEGTEWFAQLTGQTLTPPKDGRLVATSYGKGSYLDAHNDVDGERVLAYVLGLSKGSWPAEQGGHLEFLDPASSVDEVEVRERRAPGWNTLDIIDVRAPRHTHRIPILTHGHERRAISGWLYRR